MRDAYFVLLLHARPICRLRTVPAGGEIDNGAGGGARFHGHWNKGNDEPSLRFIMANDSALTLARLAMLQAVADVVAAGLAILGVTPVEEMR